MRKLVWLAAARPRSPALGSRAGAGDAAQGRHDPHDGALRRELRQPRPAHHAARPGRHRRQGDAAHALQLGLGQDDKLVLELAKSVTPSDDGLTYTYKLRDDAYFHNGRKMTADDIIWSFTRIMDGSKGYPGARYVRIIKGAVDVEKGQAKEISGLKKIDDFTLEMTLTDQRRSRLLLLRRHDRDPAQGGGREGQLRRQAGRPRTVQVQGAHSRARASSPSAGTSSTSPASPTPTSVVSARSWARPPRATSPSATRRSTPRSWARRSTSPIASDPQLSRRASSRWPRCSRAHMGMNPATSRSPTSACARRSTTRSTPT